MELWLKKGNEISAKELKKIICNQKWKEIENAYSKFTRKKSVNKEMNNFSNQSQSKKNKTEKKRIKI